MSNSFGISGSFCKTNPFQNAYLNIAELSHVTQSFLLEISPAAYFSMHFFVVYFLQLSLIGRKSHVKKDYPKIAETERHSYRKFKIFSSPFTYIVENGSVIEITHLFMIG